MWEVREENDFIFVWYHSENEPPCWQLPSELLTMSHTAIGHLETTAFTHIQVCQ